MTVQECLEDPSEVRGKGTKWCQKPTCPYAMKSVMYQNVTGESKLADVRIIPVAPQNERTLRYRGKGTVTKSQTAPAR